MASFKSTLQEHFQKIGDSLPIYKTLSLDDCVAHEMKWKSSVTLSNGQYFESEISLGKKQAEQNVAEKALKFIKH